MSRTVFFAANPSIGTTFFLDRFHVGGINRCPRVVEWADGKALIAARAYKTLGGECVAVFPADQEIGGCLQALLHSNSVETKTIPILNPIRRTYSISDMSCSPPIETEILPLGPAVSAFECGELVRLCVVACKTATKCCLSGSLPPGAPNNFYAIIANAIKKNNPNCLVLLDACGPALSSGLSNAIDILKINIHEFHQLLSVENSERSPEMIMIRMGQLAKEWGISHMVVTQGEDSLLAWSGTGNNYVGMPPSVNVVNTIGAGDCFSAGLLFGMDRGIGEGLLMGIATASAAVMTPIPGELDVETVQRLRARVELSKIRNGN